ncbi:MAG: hypothetical protein P8Y66_05130 [Nitrospirota bacterium]
MRSEKIHRLLMGILAAAAVLAGCSSGNPTSYHIRGDVDFSYIKKVAVLPFKNLAPQRNAGEIVRQMVINELLASGTVDIVVPGDVVAAMNRVGVKDVSSLSAEEIRGVGKALKVQAVIFGTVEKFGAVGLAPEVTVTMMMAETDSGTVIWSVTQTSGGAGFATKHLGARVPTMSETAMKVVRQAVGTLAQY